MLQLIIKRGFQTSTSAKDGVTGIEFTLLPETTKKKNLIQNI